MCGLEALRAVLSCPETALCSVKRLLHVLRLVLIVATLSSSSSIAGQSAGSNPQGPEVAAFLELMRQEEEELDYQLERNEISRKEYQRSKNRIAILRQVVPSLARETGEDNIPELHVLVASELGQIVESGLSALKGLKSGAIIEGKWLYRGSVVRGETFYVFERLSGT
jgi:hypothetical protein